MSICLKGDQGSERLQSQGFETVHIAGQCSLLLTNQNKKLMEQMSELSHMQEMLAAREAQVKRMENKAGLMETEVQKATQKLNSISEVIENYMVTMLLNLYDMSITIGISKILFMYWNQYKVPSVGCWSCPTKLVATFRVSRQLYANRETFISLTLQLAHYNIITCSDIQ
jgi:hypothetical protein